MEASILGRPDNGLWMRREVLGIGSVNLADVVLAFQCQLSEMTLTEILDFTRFVGIDPQQRTEDGFITGIN